MEKFADWLAVMAGKKRVRAAAIVAGIAILAMFSFRCIRHGMHITDSYIFYNAGKAIVEGGNLYGPQEWRAFFNPPFFAVFMAPFSFLSLAGFCVVWYFFNLGLLVGSFLLSIYLVRERLRGIHVLMWLLPLVIALRPIASNMTLGQSNLVVLFFTLAGLALYKKGLPLVGGIVLAVAVSAKVTPALFIPFFLYKKQWRMATGIVLGCFLFSVALPVLLMGYSKALHDLAHWWNVTRPMAVAMGPKATGAYVPGQTLRTFLMRLLTPSSIEAGANPTYINVLNLAPETVELLSRGISGLMLALMAWNFRSSPVSAQTTAPIEFALVLLTMTMISPYSRKAHYVSMIFPSIVMVHHLLEGRLDNGSKKLLKAAIIAALILGTGAAPEICGRTLSNLLSGIGTIFITAMIMWSVLNVLLFKERTTLRKEEVENGNIC
ncbi:DUF2029 domain-containing protein [Candidatus Poribacteria bacterium]|nr:DUF2029 domain-containing protein [Candidatus Poribacteria bacterium]